MKKPNAVGNSPGDFLALNYSRQCGLTAAAVSAHYRPNELMKRGKSVQV